jgi:hypothetical protein
MPLELTDTEKGALADLLKRTIDADHYPLSPRVRTLQAILEKTYAPPRAGRRRR